MLSACAVSNRLTIKHVHTQLRPTKMLFAKLTHYW